MFQWRLTSTVHDWQCFAFIALTLWVCVCVYVGDVRCDSVDMSKYLLNVILDVTQSATITILVMI